MTRLTTHVLDTAHGRPAAGMEVELSFLDGSQWKRLKTLRTNAEGRTDEPLADGALPPGQYRLEFHVAQYYRGLGMKLPEPPFLDRVPLRFGIDASGGHYHVPLLCSPWGYTTYKGS